VRAATNVVPVNTSLCWAELAALPESYATAWTCLCGNLELKAGQSVVIRGATSALVNIAADAGAQVVATTRNEGRFSKLEGLRARRVLLEGPGLSGRVREVWPHGADAVLDLVGNSTVLDYLRMARRGGRVCEAGWL